MEEDAYDKGYAARKAGKRKGANPYEQEDSRWTDWLDGWEDANADIEEGEV